MRLLAVFIVLTGCRIALAQSQNDWENPALLSQNTLVPHAHFIPYETEKQALSKAVSNRILSLDGLWKFQYSINPDVRPKKFFNDSYSTKNWATIPVPASWQLHGYGKITFTEVEYPIPPTPPFVPSDTNEVGSYKRDFTLPEAWVNKTIILHFGAVSSFFYVWINGEYVGLSKDSKTPAEFDITQYLKKGNNTIAVQVIRYSDGSYLEGQDMWKMCGIERSVYLISKPKEHILDFHLLADLDSSYANGLFSANIVTNSPNPALKIEIKLFDSAGKVIYTMTKSPNQVREIDVSTTIPSVQSWNAEHPYLYTAVINLYAENGELLESIAHKVGFRTIAITNGLFLVNGVALKIKGVNRHEFDPITGKVITTESMLNDILVMKQYNINAVRTSHYPNAEEWYELCDQYGIYLIDEANVECDGMSYTDEKTLSDKPAWEAAYLDRTKRMYERDKNYCSIITWSLGNESNFGSNFITTYNWLKEHDPSRPVQYEGARNNEYTDINCPMYRQAHEMLAYTKTWQPKPYIQCEYAHMMGNSGGYLKEYWDLFYKFPQLQGGFIWDFSDQGFARKDTNGRPIWAYGRDMGSVGPESAISFCADGLFDAARQPHPQAFELKKVYQNVHFESVPFSTDEVRITNWYDFTNLDQFIVHWKIKADGKEICSGDLPTISIQPHDSKIVQLAIPVFVRQAATEYFLVLEVTPKRPLLSLSTKHIVAWEQFPYGGIMPEKTITKQTQGTIIYATSQPFLLLSGSSFSLLFDKESGWISSIKLDGKEQLAGPLQPHFWRAVNDNDIGNDFANCCNVWKDALEGAELKTIQFKPIDSSHILVHTIHYLPMVDLLYTVEYLLNGDGDLKTTVSIKAGDTLMPVIPRIGMQVRLKETLEHVSWLGRGPYDNYWDRSVGAPIDVYSMKADQLFHPYPRAQESGYRTDVRWMTLLNSTGVGLMCQGSPTISTGVIHFDMSRMDYDTTSLENVHGGSMSNDPFITWNIDYKQMGVGGDNAWGAKPHAEYTLPYADYTYSFLIRLLVTPQTGVTRSKILIH